QWNSATFGHVAIVSAVRDGGNTIDIEEYNWTYEKSGVTYYDGKYHTRSLTRGSAKWPSNFLHIADIPVTPPAPKVGPVTAMVLDVSGSMDASFQGARKIDKAQAAARLLTQCVKDAGALTRADGKLSVTAFSSDARLQQGMTLDYAKVLAAIDKLTPGGSTNLAAGIESGLSALQASKTTYPKAMIVLSDGLANAGVSSPDAIIAGPVTKAKNAGVKIFTIGFGEAGSIDAALLERIAATTGGRYALADAGRFKTDLSNLFIDAQVSSTAKVVARFQGAVAQGKSVAMGAFTMPQGAGDLQAVLNWPGSKLRLDLTDPSGTRVKAGYPGYRTSGKRPIQVRIADAQPGKWTASVYGQEVSQPKEPYYSIVAVEKPPSPATPVPTPTAQPTGSTTSPPAPSASPSPSAKPTTRPSPKATRVPSPQASPATVALGGGGDGGGFGSGAVLLILLLAGGGLIAWLVIRERQGGGSGGGLPALVLAGVDGREHSLHEGTNTIGRGYGCDVLLDDSSVSRRHATMEVCEGRADLRDAGSTYGIRVNGRHVTERRLTVGDEVAFGAERVWLRDARDRMSP
ncbi:MAG: VWA domain-containing protein, partial [Candidatus Bipolaricaulia bacterium]